MVDCWLPYGDTEVYASVELENLLNLTEIKNVEPNRTSLELLMDVLLEPSGKSLEELVEPGVDVAIALDIFSNPQIIVQSLSEIVKILVELIVPKDRITLFLGNGESDKENKLLRDAIKDTPNLRDINLVDHNRNTSNIIELGHTHQGTTVEINTKYHSATLKIAIGETRIDPLTGFAGAHSSIVPGLSSGKTISEYRKKSFEYELSPGKIELNPIKEDVIEAVSIIGIDFALNLVTNKEGRLIAAHAGGFEDSWGKAINSLADQPEFSINEEADIAIVSPGGFPFDQSLYQAVWALHTASQVTKRNGTIVLLAQCLKGLGAEAFTQLARVTDSSELKRRYMFGADALDLLQKIKRNHRIILVSALPNYVVESLDMDVARTANEAYSLAVQSRRGKKTVVIPLGSKSIVKHRN
jgi:lactate racemase